MATRHRGPSVLIAVALAMVVGLIAWLGRGGWEAGGWWSVVLFGVPLTCTVGALVAERAGRGWLGPVALGVFAATSLGWSVFAALGIGLGFLLPSLLLVVATLISWVDRATGPSAPLPG